MIPSQRLLAASTAATTAPAPDGAQLALLARPSPPQQQQAAHARPAPALARPAAVHFPLPDVRAPGLGLEQVVQRLLVQEVFLVQGGEFLRPGSASCSSIIILVIIAVVIDIRIVTPDYYIVVFM